MMKITSILLGLVLTHLAFAQDSKELAVHTVALSGLQSGEGRYIRSDVFENNKFQSGYYFCAGADNLLYDLQYVFSKSQAPFHVEHLIKFSICQDETMTQCHEFAVDKYHTFRNKEGYLQNNVSHTTVDIASLKNGYQPCEPNGDMDELVKRSIYENDRRFSRIG